MTRWLGALLGLVAASPAHAARHELSFQFLGAFVDSDTVDQRIGSPGFPSVGLRGGAVVLRNGPRSKRFGVVIDGGWARGGMGARLDVGDVALDALTILDTFTVGTKVDVSVGDLFFPYLHVQAAVLAGQTVLDGGEVDRDAPYVDGGVTPAGLFTLGFELMVPDTHLMIPATVGFWFEAGYQAAGPMTFGALGGPVDLSGAVVSVGVGLRL